MTLSEGGQIKVKIESKLSHELKPCTAGSKCTLSGKELGLEGSLEHWSLRFSSWVLNESFHGIQHQPGVSGDTMWQFTYSLRLSWSP